MTLYSLANLSASSYKLLSFAAQQVDHYLHIAQGGKSNAYNIKGCCRNLPGCEAVLNLY